MPIRMVPDNPGVLDNPQLIKAKKNTMQWVKSHFVWIVVAVAIVVVAVKTNALQKLKSCGCG